MSGKTVDISTRDGMADAYLSEPPQQSGSRPGVLLIMDAFGLRPRIEEMADRIAAHGFVVLAPNVLYRAGRAPIMKMPDLEDLAQRDPFFARLRPAMAELTPERIESDGAAYLDYLGGVASAPFATTSYCMGGAPRVADCRSLPRARRGARGLPCRGAGDRRRRQPAPERARDLRRALLRSR
jgi:carboxymethylenebutenolidase